jgi:hypothetical protein
MYILSDSKTVVCDSLKATVVFLQFLASLEGKKTRCCLLNKHPQYDEGMSILLDSDWFSKIIITRKVGITSSAAMG